MITDYPDWTTKRILVAEDEESNYLYLLAVLRRTHAQIVWVTNGVDAVIRSEKELFHLILMDIKMPQMNGYEAIKLIRDKNIATPIIAQTAHAMGNERQLCFEAGCTAYLSKPIKPEMLLNAMKKEIEPMLL